MNFQATKLIQVHASDLDKGINSPVTYSIYQGMWILSAETLLYNITFLSKTLNF